MSPIADLEVAKKIRKLPQIEAPTSVSIDRTYEKRIHSRFEAIKGRVEGVTLPELFRPNGCPCWTVSSDDFKLARGEKCSRSSVEPETPKLRSMPEQERGKIGIGVKQQGLDRDGFKFGEA
jgi:hypothetical protein